MPGRQLQPARRGQPQRAAEFSDNPRQAAMVQALLHDEQDGLRLAGVNVDDALWRQSDRGERRRVNVGLLQHPQHLARHLGEQPSRQQRRRGAVFDLTTGARKLVRGAQRQTTGRQRRIDGRKSERHYFLPAARGTATLQACYLGPEGCKNCDVGRWLHVLSCGQQRTYREQGLPKEESSPI